MDGNITKFGDQFFEWWGERTNHEVFIPPDQFTDFMDGKLIILWIGHPVEGTCVFSPGKTKQLL